MSLLQEMLTPRRWRESLPPPGPKIAVGVLALALAGQAALIVEHVMRSSPTPPLLAPAPESFEHPGIDIAAIRRSHLFGAEPGAMVAQAHPQAASSTPLVLTGILAAADSKGGLAIISSGGSRAKLYAVGDTISGEAQVQAVYVDRVLVARGGSIEALRLPREYGRRPLLAMGEAEPRGQATADRRMRRLIGRLMRSEPVFANGKLSGYRIYPGVSLQAFISLGLKPGDVVTEVNGTRLDTAARGALLHTLAPQGPVALTLMRDGQEMEVALDLSQLAEPRGIPTLAPGEPFLNP